jgi:small conductance mechanosensitive channel
MGASTAAKQWVVGALGAVLSSCLVAGAAVPQPESAPAQPIPAEDKPGPKAPATVEVQPLARDHEIRDRLERILQATGWFEGAGVQVDEGVAFLEGHTREAQYKNWATDLAQNTRDVVAVVNRIQVQSPSPWDFRPALAGLQQLQRDAMYSLPFLFFGLLILVLSYAVAVGATRALRPSLRRQVAVPLLREVIARSVGLLLFLFGLYLVLKVSGLTRLALTVLGGTGLAGLVIGIAFRDITENFLASILLSIQRPFRVGDLVEIEGSLGYIQQLNVRTTVLMTLTGNHVQIPNAAVYKAKLINYTSNANRREDFVVGVGYDVLIPDAQAVVLEVLADHPAVLHDPEPWVLVDGLGAATVNLRVYFWLNGKQHSWLKVKSSVIRLVKRAFQEHGIGMPDEAREIVFPHGIAVHLARDRRNRLKPDPEPDAAPSEPSEVSVQGEAGLQSDAEQIEQQARMARAPEEAENLLES